jgi:hypothetical protein
VSKKLLSNWRTRYQPDIVLEAFVLYWVFFPDCLVIVMLLLGALYLLQLEPLAPLSAIFVAIFAGSLAILELGLLMFYLHFIKPKVGLQTCYNFPL